MGKLTQATVLRSTLDSNPNKVFTVAELHKAITEAGITDVFEVQVLGYVRVMASRGQALRGPEPNTFTSVNYKGGNAKGPKKATQNAPVASQETPRATRQTKSTTSTPPVSVIDAAQRIKAAKGTSSQSKSPQALLEKTVIASTIGTAITTKRGRKTVTAGTNEVDVTPTPIGQVVRKRVKAGTMSLDNFMTLIAERFGCPQIAKSETTYAHCFQFSQEDCTNYNLDYLEGRCQTISNGKQPLWWAAIVNDVVNVGIYAQEK